MSETGPGESFLDQLRQARNQAKAEKQEAERISTEFAKEAELREAQRRLKAAALEATRKERASEILAIPAKLARSVISAGIDPDFAVEQRKGRGVPGVYWILRQGRYIDHYDSESYLVPEEDANYARTPMYYRESRQIPRYGLQADIFDRFGRIYQCKTPDDQLEGATFKQFDQITVDNLDREVGKPSIDGLQQQLVDYVLRNDLGDFFIS